MDHLSLYLKMFQARDLSPNTVRNYQTYLKPFLTYLDTLGISPESVSRTDVRSFLTWIQAERSLSDHTVNMIISHLQFFWIYVLHKPWDSSQIPFHKFDTYLPFDQIGRERG